MLARTVCLVAALAACLTLLLMRSTGAQASHPSITLYRYRYLEASAGTINYSLCGDAQNPASPQWEPGVENWDSAIGRWEFSRGADCSTSVRTQLRWEPNQNYCADPPPPARTSACWESGATSPHGSHADLQFGQPRILFDRDIYSDTYFSPSWRIAITAHEWGHNMSLADHDANPCPQGGIGSIMGRGPPNPLGTACIQGPTSPDLASVDCNVYGRCGDFSGDSCTDLLARSGVNLLIYRGNCGGTFSDQSGVTIGTGGWEAFNWLLRPGDFNGSSPNSNTGETCTDVIAHDAGSPYWARLYRGNCGQGGQYFKDLCCGTQIGSGWGIYSWVLAPGDFSGDNCPDVIFRNGDVLQMARGNCAGQFIDQSAFTISGPGWSQGTWLLGPGDWNGDGCQDIIERFNNGTLRLYRGNCGAGGQYWKDCCGIDMGGGVNWSSYNWLASPGDFTGDGCMDLFSRDSVGTLRVHYGNCGTGFINSGGTVVGTGWNIIDYIY